MNKGERCTHAGRHDRRPEQLYVHLPAGDPAGGRRTVFHGPQPLSAAAAAEGVHPCGGGAAGEGGERVLLPGADGVHSVPCGHGQHHRRVRGHLRGRLRRRVLDVAHRPAGRRHGVYRVHPGPDLQAPEPGDRRELRRPRLLYRGGSPQQAPGGAVRPEPHRHLCRRLQHALLL